MFTAYVVLTLIAAATTAMLAVLDLIRHPIPLRAAEQVRVSASWVRPIGWVFLAATVGLLAGFVIPPLGIAAATGLVLFFVCATIAHLRIGDFRIGPPAGVLVLAIATLVVTLAYQVG
ncbi:hypothetical protein F4561_000261 [Lipingzhangella halophila]|uniref:DoxX-like family protein n=1 Tax=Lipingzhangella halophila TaxID=1783352 RepID=A0A7W7RDK4_9ACTN|nr:DoxX family protein [Lipingzhangella halophila]MBB4929441.1 hypothetical protein [Lipingzhangella halophila]